MWVVLTPPPTPHLAVLPVKAFIWMHKIRSVIISNSYDFLNVAPIQWGMCRLFRWDGKWFEWEAAAA